MNAVWIARTAGNILKLLDKEHRRYSGDYFTSDDGWEQRIDSGMFPEIKRGECFVYESNSPVYKPRKNDL
jgi:hypothetical protein